MISSKIEKIFEAINEYEVESFMGELETIKNVIIRIEHNNETLSLIQSKLNAKMISSKEYHRSCIGKFMKEVSYDCLKMADTLTKSAPTKPIYEYSFFIF